MNLLIQYYEGKIPSLAEEGKEEKQIATLTEDEEVGLLEEAISPKSNLPPLLLKLSERPAEQLDYLGVSYGLTGQLLRYTNVHSMCLWDYSKVGIILKNKCFDSFGSIVVRTNEISPAFGNVLVDGTNRIVFFWMFGWFFSLWWSIYR